MPAPIQAIIDNDLCIACGACVEICPPKIVRPVFNELRATPEVMVAEPDACVACPGPCGTVCPSITTDFAALLGEPVARTGRVREVLVAQAPAHSADGTSSSGGVLRLLATEAVRSGTPVICLVADPVEDGSGERVRYGAAVLQSLEDVGRMPGSIYHATDFGRALSLLRELETPCLLIAIPCQLAGLLSYIDRSEPMLRDRIGIIAGIICGWMYSHHGLDAFASFKGLAEPWRDAGYRGEDKVGKLKLIMRSGTDRWDRREFSRVGDMIDFRSSFSTEMNRLRCRLCEDHLNVLADISVGDAWLARTTAEKTSVVAVRSAAGAELIDRHVRAGRLLTAPGSFADLVESQSRDLVYGVTAGRLAAWRRGQGLPSPDFRYVDTPPTVQLTLAERWRFRIETMLRGWIRHGWYRSYRAAYVVTHLRMTLRFWGASLRRRLRGGG